MKRLHGFMLGLAISMLAITVFHRCARASSVDSGSTTRLAISFGPSLNGSTNPKYVSVGIEKELGNLALLIQCSGIFEDPLLGACSAVASIKVVTISGLFARVGVGPGVVTHTDERLSSIPEFNIRYAAGITQGSVEVGAEGSHWSNAGLFGGQNLGRDHLGFYLGINF